MVQRQIWRASAARHNKKFGRSLVNNRRVRDDTGAGNAGADRMVRAAQPCQFAREQNERGRQVGGDHKQFGVQLVKQGRGGKAAAQGRVRGYATLRAIHHREIAREQPRPVSPVRALRDDQQLGVSPSARWNGQRTERIGTGETFAC